jgi:hypothetical protein
MSKHKDEIRFWHMLDHAREALAMIQGKERSNLDSNRMLELSLAGVSQPVERGEKIADEGGFCLIDI